MRYQTYGSDQIVEGETFSEVVASMAGMKMDEVRSIKAYRKATAERVSVAFGKKVDHSTDEKFVKSLVDAGMLTEVQHERSS